LRIQENKQISNQKLKVKTYILKHNTLINWLIGIKTCQVSSSQSLPLVEYQHKPGRLADYRYYNLLMRMDKDHLDFTC